MITVRECTYEDRERYDRLEGEYHYMGESHGAGNMIRLVFEEDGKWIALMTWAASCYALKLRDERIGWNPAMRASRLKLVVNNRRFAELVPKGSRPNLASQILGMASGAKDLKAAIAYAKRLSQKQLRSIGCPNAKDATGEDVPDRYAVPSYTAFYYLLGKLDMREYAKRLTEWMREQAGTPPRHLAVDGRGAGRSVCPSAQGDSPVYEARHAMT